jgi:hypothetical protein
MAQIIKMHDGRPMKVNDKDLYGSDLIGVVKSVNLDQRKLVMIGTTETKDRDKDIIKVNGWQLDNYRKNPVFLWSHNYGSVPLARAEKVIKRRDPVRMDFHLLFPTKGLYPFADMILELYAEKIINASSVGFIPLEWEINPEDEKEESWRRGKIYTKQELLELSGCAVPSNPDAIQDALKTFKSIGRDVLSLSLTDWTDLLMGKSKLPVPNKKDDVLEELEDKDMEIQDESSSTFVQVSEEIAPLEKEGEKPVEVVLPNEELIPVESLKEGEVEFEEKDFITKEDVLKPYPNEHACRLKSPDGFDKFARKNCHMKHDDKCIDIIFGIKEGKSSIQAMRYPKSAWKASDAKSHCGSHKGTFEAASSETVSVEVPEYVKLFETQVEKMFGEMKEMRAEFKAQVEALIELIKSGSVQAEANVPPKDKETQSAAEAILNDAFSGKQLPAGSASQDGKYNPESLKELRSAILDLKNVMANFKLK